MVHLIKNALLKLKSYQYRHLDVRLICVVIGITILGINVTKPDDPSFFQKQIAGFILGLLIMTFIALMDYHFVLKFYLLIYLLNAALLVSVLLFGANHMGAQRWIEFGDAFQIQPSEFTKIFLILFYAKFLENHKDKISSFKIVVSSVIFLGIPILLIFKQPDLSTSIVIGLIFCAIMYIAGLSYKVIFGIILSMIPIAAGLIFLIMQPNQKILDPYQVQRIEGFFSNDDEASLKEKWQQENSEMAIGSGGLWGKGLNNDDEDSVKNGNFIPEAQTDFIFAIVGEELGFVGTSTVILGLLWIVIECFIVGAYAADLSGRIICCGIGSYIAIQTFINICVVTNMIPNTGLPLPFISYGLTSLLASYIGIGFVLNVSLQRGKNTTVYCE